jgi:hypothetical protein
MAADGKRFRSSRACTSCRQMKVKCDRRDKGPHRCTRCEITNIACEIDHNFQRRRMKGSNEDVQDLRREMELLKSQVAPLVPRTISGSLPDAGNPVPGSSSSPFHSARAYMLTLPRSTAEITLLPWQIEAGFDTFFEKMHPFLPFLVRPEPNACFEREPFLFWTICMLGLRRDGAPCAKALAAYVSSEATQAPYSRCHCQSKATSVVQALLLLSLVAFQQHLPSTRTRLVARWRCDTPSFANWSQPAWCCFGIRSQRWKEGYTEFNSRISQDLGRVLHRQYNNSLHTRHI